MNVNKINYPSHGIYPLFNLSYCYLNMSITTIAIKNMKLTKQKLSLNLYSYIIILLQNSMQQTLLISEEFINIIINVSFLSCAGHSNKTVDNIPE